LSESDLSLLEVVDLGVEALQVGVVEVESQVFVELERISLGEDRDHCRELEAVLGAVGELKAAAREMRAWAASIGACG
jgi:hypothetical protein